MSNNTDPRVEALKSLTNEKVKAVEKMPRWAQTWIGLSGVLVTIVVALGLNLGTIIEKKITNAMELKTMSIENTYATEKSALDALTKNTESLNVHILNANQLNRDLLAENGKLQQEVRRLQTLVQDLEKRIKQLEQRVK